jgi:hypothetical protein
VRVCGTVLEGQPQLRALPNCSLWLGQSATAACVAAVALLMCWIQFKY